MIIGVFQFWLNAQQLAIIPKPQLVEIQNGLFELSEKTKIIVPDGCDFEMSFLKERISELYKIELIENKRVKTKGSFIQFEYLKGVYENDYKLKIDNAGVHISGPSRTSFFYGIQTLLQIIESCKEADKIMLPYCEIHDFPNYKWRGMHLDVSRHFFSVSEIKKYLDYMALYKMNVFHWHLTDDQGWRIEMKEFPELTNIGAVRSGNMIGHYREQKFDTLSYGGFYTQEEIKEIIQYASERNITIVPEIEMPGHSLAAIATYPHLSCNKQPLEVGVKWGVYEDVYCAGNDSVFIFLEQILKEVITLFPGDYIHIGGDECPKSKWKNCPKCQQRIQNEQLQNEQELQSYFIQRIEKFFNENGKKIIGWDEILEGGLAPNAAVMSWRGEEGGIEASQMNHFVVMTPGRPCYFDHYQVEKTEFEPIAIGGLNTLRDVYYYNPIPDELNEKFKHFILGAQGNVWTEYMSTFKQVEYMALPRMAALSEVLWGTSNPNDYNDFLKRLNIQIILLDFWNANYCKHFKSEINE